MNEKPLDDLMPVLYEALARLEKLNDRLNAADVDRDKSRVECNKWKAIAERIHELVFTDYEFSSDFTEVVIDIENEQADLQYHVDVCRDSGLVPSRVPFRRLGE